MVAKLRGIIGIKRIGHGGTLDPLATGLLVVGIGKATKQLEQFVQGDKSYRAEIRLGFRSTTDDAEGETTPGSFTRKPELREIESVLEKFRGEQLQIPPVYSAIKTAGKKHYELARAGKKAERKPRAVTVHELGLVKYDWPVLTVTTKVSKGTYIRALARDIGETLGTGGYLEQLRRETVGNLSIEAAHSLEELERNWQNHLQPTS